MARTLNTEPALEIVRRMERRGEFDEALSVLEAIGQDIVDHRIRRGALLSKIGEVRGEKWMQAEARSVLQEVLDVTANVDQQAECHIHIGMSYVREELPAQGVNYFRQALALAENNDLLALAYINRSVMYLCLKDYKSALADANAAKPYADVTGDPFLQGNYCHQASLACKNLGDYEQAILLNLYAATYYEICGHRRFQARMLNGLGDLYRLTGKRDEARASLEEAKLIAIELGDPTLSEIIEESLIELFWHGFSIEEELKLREEEYLKQALADAKGDSSLAAKFLGAKLNAKLKRKLAQCAGDI